MNKLRAFLCLFTWRLEDFFFCVPGISHINLATGLLQTLFFHLCFLLTKTQFLMCNMRLTRGPPFLHLETVTCSPLTYCHTPDWSLSFKPANNIFMIISIFQICFMVRNINNCFLLLFFLKLTYFNYCQ